MHRPEHEAHDKGSQEQPWNKCEWRRMPLLGHDEQCIVVGQISPNTELTIHLSSVNMAIVGAAQEAFLETLLDSCCHIHKHLCNVRVESVSPITTSIYA